MRTLLALFFSWLMPSTGKRRATEQRYAVHTPDTADAPTRRLIISRNAVGVEHPREHLRGEDVALIRPYLIAWERTHGIHYSQEAAA